MVTVDQKGRVVLPQEIRERLGISPGTEVEIKEENGKAVVKPEDDPEQVIERMEELIEETSSQPEERGSFDEEADPIAQKHRDVVRRGAQKAKDDDG